MRSPDVGTAEVLGRACATTSWRRAPEPVRERVVDLVADCVAVSAFGSRRHELRRLRDGYACWSGSGAATVAGSARGWPAGTAALLNGSAVAADQLQDGHRLARGHPASHVVPAVLAMAEETDAAGDEVLSAVLAGYETGVRVGRALGGTPPGVHDLGTWGEVAAAAGTARLLAPADSQACRRAVELAASAVLLADAATVFSGRTGGHVFLGASSALGASLGAAAVAGLEPAAGVLDRHLAAVAAAEWDGARLGDGISGDTWNRWEVLEGYLKIHPTCAHLHGVNDAVQDLLAGRQGAGFAADAIAEVEVRAFAGAARFDQLAAGELEARFSVPTSVALALVSGGLDPAAVDDAAVRDPLVVDLARRVAVVHDPALDAGYPAGRPARVRVVLTDGSQFAAGADRPRGDADRAVSRGELAGKAARLLRQRFGPAGDDVLAAVHALGDSGTARQAGAALRHAALAVGEES